MRKFDNISALENLSLDSDFQPFTGTRSDSISYLISAFNALKGINVTINDGYGVYNMSNDEPEYGNFFSVLKLGQSDDATLLAIANEVETIVNNLTNRVQGQSSEKYAINGFRTIAQKYYPILKGTYYNTEYQRFLLVESLPQEYKDVFKEPFYSDNLSQTEKVDMAGELRTIANNNTLSNEDKRSLAIEILRTYIPTLPSYSPMTTTSSTSQTEQRAESTSGGGSNVAKFAIVGGVIIVGGIATWLILRKK
jgi:hypothetical protein